MESSYKENLPIQGGIQNLDRTQEFQQKDFYRSEEFQRTLKMLSPTEMIAAQLQASHQYYNEKAFNGELPAVMYTLDASSKVHGGYFKPYGFMSLEGLLVHEIAMNAKVTLLPDLRYVLSIQFHEMCHVLNWDQAPPHKKPSGGYHNKKWADLMESFELIPSDTGEPGGNRIGNRMSHWIKHGGKFDQMTNELLATDFVLSWGQATERMRIAQMFEDMGNKAKAQEIRENGLEGIELPSKFGKKKKDRSGGKHKYSCPECNDNIWGKSGMLIKCISCDAGFVEGAQ